MIMKEVLLKKIHTYALKQRSFLTVDPTIDAKQPHTKKKIIFERFSCQNDCMLSVEGGKENICWKLVDTL